jgi:hypothetical protein
MTLSGLQSKYGVWSRRGAYATISAYDNNDLSSLEVGVQLDHGDDDDDGCERLSVWRKAHLSCQQRHTVLPEPDTWFLGFGYSPILLLLSVARVCQLRRRELRR